MDETATTATFLGRGFVRTYRTGEVLLRAGERTDHCLLVLHGRAVVTRDGVPVEVITRGDWTGELAALVDGPRAATVTATTDVEVLVVAASELRRILADDHHFRSRVMAGLVQKLRTTTPRAANTAAHEARLAILTKAERRVAELVATGCSNVAIAEQLLVSRTTVESHLKRAYLKLGIHSRVELATTVIGAIA
jgi:CRP-like cAMP-binding protein